MKYTDDIQWQSNIEQAQEKSDFLGSPQDGPVSSKSQTWCDGQGCSSDANNSGGGYESRGGYQSRGGDYPQSRGTWFGISHDGEDGQNGEYGKYEEFHFWLCVCVWLVVN
nr:unnamed protein product [Callosobruchus chinensis]